MEQSVLIELSNKINSFNSINKIQLFEQQSNISLEHPYAKMLLGYKYSMLNDKKSSLVKFIQCIELELKQDFIFKDTIFADSIGLSIANICLDYINNKLVEDYNDGNKHTIFNFWLLGYFYLSNHLINFNYLGYNSLEIRGKLIERFNEYASDLSFQYYSFGSIPIVLAISDYYYSSLLYKEIGDINSSNRLFNAAKNLHSWLEDISISGRNANEYSLDEIAENGKKRHVAILNNLKDKFEIKYRKNDYKELLEFIQIKL